MVCPRAHRYCHWLREDSAAPSASATWGHRLGFSLCACAQWLQSCLTLCKPVDCSPPGSSVQDSPGKNTGVGCHALIQGIFPTPDWIRLWCFLHWQADSLPLAPPGKPSGFQLLLNAGMLWWSLQTLSHHGLETGCIEDTGDSVCRGHWDSPGPLGNTGKLATVRATEGMPLWGLQKPSSQFCHKH